MLNRVKFVGWLRQMAVAKDGSLSRLVLKHLDAGNKAASLWELVIDGNSSVDDIAGQVDDAATADAEGIGGTNRYTVQAFFGKEKEPGSRFAFRIMADEMAQSDAGNPSESADAKGITAQHMRFTEAFAKSTFGTWGELTRRQNSMIEMLTKSNAEMAQVHVNLVQMQQELLNQDVERRLSVQQAVTKTRREDALFQSLKMLAPVVVNKLAGQKLLPEKATATEASLSALLSTITPEQLTALSGILNPHQQLVLYEMLQQTVNADEKEEKARAQAEEEMAKAAGIAKP